MIVGAYLAGCRLRTDIRMFEESHLEFHPEHPFAGFVDVGLGDNAFRQGLLQPCMTECSQVDVDTGLQCHCSRFGTVGSDMMGVVDTVDAVEVGNDKALELPVVAEQLVEQLAVDGVGYAVDRVIGGHHREGPGIDSLAEWRQEVLVQLAWTEVRWRAVLSAFGGAVGDEVLECGDGTVFLCQVTAAQSFHHGSAHEACQHRVFTVGLFHA